MSLFLQISLGYLLLVLQSLGCDQTYATWSTGSESNINEEGLERKKKKEKRKKEGVWREETDIRRKKEFVLCKNTKEKVACINGGFYSG